MSLNLLQMNGLTVTGGPTNTVDLGNSIVGRPAPTQWPQPIHYSQLSQLVDTIQDVPHIWYFTLAKGFSPETTTGKYWHDAMRNALTILDPVTRSKTPININLSYNLEYHSDEITLHAHGLVYDTPNKELIKFKRNIRKSFNIDPRNRVAIKWYQNNNPNHTHLDKIKYHLTSTNYNNTKKSNLEDNFTLVRGSVAGASCAV